MSAARVDFFRDFPRAVVLCVLLISSDGAADRDTTTAERPFLALELASKVDHLDALAHEPMVVEHPDGTLFVTGFARVADPEAPPQLWRSDDRGESWARIDVGTSQDGAIGNSDPDLAVSADGTLYSIHLGYDRTTHRGTHVAIGASPDKGVTWTWTTLSSGREEDRPWIDVAPDGTAHAIWNDNRGGVSHARSDDRGETWEIRDRIHPVGGSSHLAVGPNGEVAVRITPLSWGGFQFDEEIELIAVSTDGGETWIRHEAPGNRQWIADADRTAETTLIDRWAETLAWDAAGALYYLWSEERALWLARSPDRGESWRSWPIVRDTTPMFYPFVVAGDPGRLAAVWLSGNADPLSGGYARLYTHVARIELGPGEDATPTVLRSKAFQGDSWTSSQPPSRSPGGDYLPVVLLSDGAVGAVTPIQDSDRGRYGFTWWRFEARQATQ